MKKKQHKEKEIENLKKLKNMKKNIPGIPEFTQ